MARSVVIVLGAVVLAACSKSSAPTSPAPASSTSVTSYAPAVLPAAAASASTPFEGEITLAVTNASTQKLPTTITYDIKGDKVRYAPTAASVRAIDDQTTQQVFAIDDTAKTYEQVDTKNAKVLPDPNVNKTTKSETIAGVACNDWTIDTGDTKVDVCAAPGIAFFDLDRDAKSGALEPAWATALTKAKAFPLRAIVRDKAGKEQYRVQATTVAHAKVDDTRFAVPPTSFKKMDLGSDEKQIALP